MESNVRYLHCTAFLELERFWILEHVWTQQLQIWGCGPAFQYSNGCLGLSCTSALLAPVHDLQYVVLVRLVPCPLGTKPGPPSPPFCASLTSWQCSLLLPLWALLLTVFVWGIPSPTSPSLRPGIRSQLFLLLSASFFSSKLLLVVLS